MIVDILSLRKCTEDPVCPKCLNFLSGQDKRSPQFRVQIKFSLVLCSLLCAMVVAPYSMS